MTLQYRHKWSSTEGEIFDNDDKLAPNFLSWCYDLRKFTDVEWKRVFKRIQGDIHDAAKQGDELWPPSSQAVVAYAHPPVNAGMYRPFDRSRALEDKTAKEKRKALGREECEKLLSMFD